MYIALNQQKRSSAIKVDTITKADNIIFKLCNFTMDKVNFHEVFWIIMSHIVCLFNPVNSVMCPRPKERQIGGHDQLTISSNVEEWKQEKEICYLLSYLR